jgi:transglutaminase-like putative cysteine protease
MRYQIVHKTQYQYAHPVDTSYQHLHLTPRTFSKQRVLDAQLLVDPTPVSFEQREDYFGNLVTDIVIRSRHQSLNITSHSQVEVKADPAILLDLSPPWEQAAAAVRVPQSEDAWDAARFCFASPQLTLDAAYHYALTSVLPGAPLLRAVEALTDRIHREFEYRGGVTDVFTPVPEVLAARTGVCQDFAHLAIACLRSLGLPARYVSGYLMNQPEQGQIRLTGADASHAWFSVWCPEFGWVDFDPTNNLRPQNEHITLGWGRDYGDVSPTRGFIHGGGSQWLDVSVDVSPLAQAGA